MSDRPRRAINSPNARNGSEGDEGFRSTSGHSGVATIQPESGLSDWPLRVRQSPLLMSQMRQMRTLTCRREPEVQVGFCLRAHSRPLADAVNRPLSHSACRPLSNAGIVEG